MSRLWSDERCPDCDKQGIYEDEDTGVWTCSCEEAHVVTDSVRAEIKNTPKIVYTLPE